MQSTAEGEIHLSVVATSRNDNHGGSLTHRMQHFVDGFVAQCKRHGLRAELILVEWNPPHDRMPLAQELRWPAESGPCDIRIITVPPDVHARLEHAHQIPLFQMIAKNVGIRRARGRFVLATNIDILFSDSVMQALRTQLKQGYFYRVDRVDVPTNLPAGRDFGEVLAFCEANGFRVHTNGATLVRGERNYRLIDRINARLDARDAYLIHLVELAWKIACKLPFQPRRSFRTGWRMLVGAKEKVVTSAGAAERGLPPAVSQLPPRSGAPIRRLVSSLVSRLLVPWPFTNACGDFTAMSRADWFRLRGYAEWHIFSWHLDSLLIYQAVGCGIKQKHLKRPARIFHIEHGRGYTPEGAADLFSRLTSQGIPFLENTDLDRLKAQIEAKRRSKSEIRFNDASWGMADMTLPETWPVREHQNSRAPATARA